jgi:deoxycytidine triphosphate deaminase
MFPLFPPDFDQKVLWLDPLQPAAELGTVLRAEEVWDYVNTHNLIIDRGHFQRKHLKGASYSTSPDPSEAWIIESTGHRKKLSIDADAKGRYFVVPANSFVFIRLLQELRMPFYLVGRFNLKIRYVYRGLLLGTGPHIDPGYIGRIYIPLHNFTNESVNIYIDDSFVSFEFARTAPIRFPSNISNSVPATLEEFYRFYADSLRLIDLEKITERSNLEAYLEGSRPYSALGVLVQELLSMEAKFTRRKVVEWTAAVSIAVLVVAYAASTFDLFNSARERDSRLQDEIHKISQTLTPQQATLQERVEKLTEELRQVRQGLRDARPIDQHTPSPSSTKAQP